MEKKKKDESVYASGQTYPEQPSVMDRFKEAFQPTSTKAEVEAVRRRRAKLNG